MVYNVRFYIIDHGTLCNELRYRCGYSLQGFTTTNFTLYKSEYFSAQTHTFSLVFRFDRYNFAWNETYSLVVRLFQNNTRSDLVEVVSMHMMPIPTCLLRERFFFVQSHKCIRQNECWWLSLAYKDLRIQKSNLKSKT